MKAPLAAKTKLRNVTTTDGHHPYRCSFDVPVVAVDTDPDVDDAANPEGNTTTVDLEVSDRNDY